MALRQIKTKSFCVKGFAHRVIQPEDILNQMSQTERKFTTWLESLKEQPVIVSVSHSHFEKEVKMNHSMIMTSILVVYKTD